MRPSIKPCLAALPCQAAVGLALLCGPLGAAALAHGSSAPLQGEHAHQEKALAETLWRLLLPEAGAAASITIKGNFRYISANGHPDTSPGRFPNKKNPHAIGKKTYTLRVPLAPRMRGRKTETGPTPFGISLDGVLMDPGTAETWQNDPASRWSYEALGGGCSLGLDKNNAHVQPDGTYHYHALSPALLKSGGGTSVPVLIGYAADGFPVYGPYGYSNPKTPTKIKNLTSSYRLRPGARPSGPGDPGGFYNGVFSQDWTYAKGSGDLDECNGRFAVTPEYPQGTYQYVLTSTFPYIPRCWSGTADNSFKRLKRQDRPRAQAPKWQFRSASERGRPLRPGWDDRRPGRLFAGSPQDPGFAQDALPLPPSPVPPKSASGAQGRTGWAGGPCQGN